MTDELDIAEEKVTGPSTWREMSASERLDLLVQAIEPPETAAAVRQAVSMHFGPEGPGDFFVATNVMLREASRLQHGDTGQWDAAEAAAKAQGLNSPVPPSAMDKLMARKHELTPEQVAMEMARIQAPQPRVVGLSRWAGQVRRPQDTLFLPVVVEWPRGGGTPDVVVAGRKVNGKQRRRWLDLLAQKGVTVERVEQGVRLGVDRVSVDEVYECDRCGRQQPGAVRGGPPEGWWSGSPHPSDGIAPLFCDGCAPADDFEPEG